MACGVTEVRTVAGVRPVVAAGAAIGGAAAAAAAAVFEEGLTTWVGGPVVAAVAVDFGTGELSEDECSLVSVRVLLPAAAPALDGAAALDMFIIDRMAARLDTPVFIV